MRREEKRIEKKSWSVSLNRKRVSVAVYMTASKSFFFYLVVSSPFVVCHPLFFPYHPRSQVFFQSPTTWFLVSQRPTCFVLSLFLSVVFFFVFLCFLFFLPKKEFFLSHLLSRYVHPLFSLYLSLPSNIDTTKPMDKSC